MKYDPKTLKAYGFRLVYIPQVRTHRPWFSAEEDARWGFAGCRYMTEDEQRARRKNPAEYDDKPFRYRYGYYCETLEAAKRSIQEVYKRLKRLKERDERAKDAKILECRIVSAWHYFGTVEKDTETVELLDECR